MVDLGKLKQIYKLSKDIRLEDANELIKSARAKTFEKKEIIIDEGSKRNELFFVRKGLVRQYTINEKGEEITFGLIPENFIVANVDIILFQQPSRFYFEAFENTKTFSIDYDVMQDILTKNSKLQSNRIYIVQRMMKEMHQRIESFVYFTPEERYQKFIENYPDVANRVPDKYLSSVLGITPISLSRIRGRIAAHKSNK